MQEILKVRDSECRLSPRNQGSSFGGGGSKGSPQHMTAVGSISGPIKGALCSFAEDEKDLR